MELFKQLGGQAYGDQVLVNEINGRNDTTLFRHQEMWSTYTSEVEYATFLHILEGSMDITLDYRNFHIAAHTWIGVFPASSVMYSRVSKDFRALMVIISKPFFDKSVSSNKTLPTNAIVGLKLREIPILNLSLQESRTLENCIIRLQNHIQEEEHLFRREMIHITFLSYLLEFANIALSRNAVKEVMATASRKEIHTQTFLQLVRKNGKREHSLAFYSNQMCISSKYLSILIKETTGRTAKSWISANIIMEAKILFRKPGMTIQAISDELNFSDQASFSKFFKKTTGVPPKKYLLAQ